MTQHSDITRLDEAIAALESKLAAYRALRDVLENAEAANEVRGFFAVNGLAGAEQRGPKSKIMLKIQEFFDSRDNEWATITEMAAGTKLKRPSLRQALYKGHASKFERDSRPGGGRETRFRLKK